jgi:hypothetical protein
MIRRRPIMKKKFLLGLAPLLITASFAVVPAASQAAPHVYKNGIIGAPGKKVREISWGTLKLKNATLGEVICHNLFAGFAENPVGEGAAIGKVQAFAPYECESPSCIALGGKGIQVTAGKMPWVAEAIEPKPGVFRQKTGHKSLTPGKKPNEVTEPAFVDFNVNCEGVTTPEFFGENRSLVLNNGISIGAGPGELELQPAKVNPESPDLESELVGNGETEGTVKVEGYGAEELIEVKNP